MRRWELGAEENGVAVTLKDYLAQERWGGRIDFAIEIREPDRVVGRMLITGEALNPFGTVHIGAMIWFAYIRAALCAIGDPESIDDDGKGFPLVINLRSVRTGNQSEGNDYHQSRQEAHYHPHSDSR
jgi:1,4-dihydroxy-2-naphthoyl-CoA hydrolase